MQFGERIPVAWKDENEKYVEGDWVFGKREFRDRTQSSGEPGRPEEGRGERHLEFSRYLQIRG